MSIREQVAEFHRAIGAGVETTPRGLSREKLELRLSLIAEEFVELLVAAGYFIGPEGVMRNPMGRFDMVEVADALGDLDYVCEGFRLELGIDGRPIAAEIHRTNMAKVNGPLRADGKRLKPEGWLPPDVRGLLIAQGWTPPGGDR
jgi:predicted HAD superfamily Cof-like phosphohydrolase